MTCGVLDLCRQAYYRRLEAPVTVGLGRRSPGQRDAVDSRGRPPAFGYRFIADELARAGHDVGENRVHRLAREHQICSATVRKGRKAKRVGPPVHDDLVQRDFDVAEPDRVWLTDIIEHPTGEGKLYLAVIKDACSNRIVGYAPARG